MAGSAFGCGRARGSIRRLHARAGTVTGQTAFVIGILTVADIFANAVESVTLFRIGTGHARQVANVAATEPVGAIIRNAFSGRSTRHAIVVFACARPGTLAVRAFVVRIGGVGNRSARTIGAAAFFGGGARFAKT